MPLQFETESKNRIVMWLSGELEKVEFDQAIDKCKKVIEENGPVTILVLAENFMGWERAEGWEDTSFADRYDPHIEKMAIVCEKKWHDSMHMFTLKEQRPFDIKFFEPGQAKTARLWLDIA